MAIVTYVTGDCPGCGGQRTFGKVMVTGHEVYLGCGKCRYNERIHLPPIKKKVIYLDQCVLSGAFRGNDARFVEVVERTKHLCSLQLAVAPYSSVHEDETHQWRGHAGRSFAQLMDFIKSTAGGSEFEPAYRVQEEQTVKGFQAFLAQANSNYVLHERDAIRGDIHEWSGYVFIDVGRYMGDVEEMRTLKQQAVSELVGLFDGWASSTSTFDEDVAIEQKASGDAYMSAYFEMARRTAEVGPMAMLNAPIAAMTVQHLRHCMPRGTDHAEALRTIRSYFDSAHYAQLPSERLSTTMFATMKDMVKRGAYAKREDAVKRLSGVFYDVKHISTYAPYCDAFFMDQPMADMVCSPTVRLDQIFGTKVFSLNSIDGYFQWLEQLEAGMTDEHRRALDHAYGK